MEIIDDSHYLDAKVRSHPKIRLSSVTMIHRILYLNNDPSLNYMLPLINAWNVNELADEIRRACIEYDVTLNYDNARFLAFVLAEKIVKENSRFEGGMELG